MTTKPRKPADAHPAPDPTPAATLAADDTLIGGSWLRQEDGSLVRATED